jgi:hypothetical protein
MTCPLVVPTLIAAPTENQSFGRFWAPSCEIRVKLEASLYTLLQVFSVTVFEKMLIQSALLPEIPQFDGAINVNRLNLFAV